MLSGALGQVTQVITTRVRVNCLLELKLQFLMQFPASKVKISIILKNKYQMIYFMNFDLSKFNFSSTKGKIFK